MSTRPSLRTRARLLALPMVRALLPTRSRAQAVLSAAPGWRLMTLLLSALAGCGTPPPDTRNASAIKPATTTAASTTAPAQPEGASGYREGLRSVHAQKHMVAAANPLAAQAGLAMLRAGGSAIDATIATQMVLTLVEPQSSGLGGGAFLMHWDGKRIQSFDGREKAPAGVDERLFLKPDGKPMAFYDAVVGGRSVGVPGALSLLWTVHHQHGKLPWPRLFEPAITLAEQGFAISLRLHQLLVDDAARLRTDPQARAYFYQADGRARAVGTRLTNPALADTLKKIARDGISAFYEGPIARDVVQAVQHRANPGRLTLADLRTYNTRERSPVCVIYRVRYRVCGAPPPSSGGIAVAQMLGILSHTDIADQRPNKDSLGHLIPTPQAVHLFAQAGRLAYADRAQYIADPDQIPVDTAALIDPNYLADRAQLVGERSQGPAPAGKPPSMKQARWGIDTSPLKTSTSQISVVDDQGQAVSMTTSIEDVFGARMMVRGFLLNNQLTDFSFEPQDARGLPIANRVQPGKRPRSSMAPTLVFDEQSGALLAVLGSPGGSQIINYVARTLVGWIDWQLDIQDAIGMPNFGSRNQATELESGFMPDSLRLTLEARGHEVKTLPLTSGLQAIVAEDAQAQDVVADPPGWRGGADPRREGVVLGD